MLHKRLIAPLVLCIFVSAAGVALEEPVTPESKNDRKPPSSDVTKTEPIEVTAPRELWIPKDASTSTLNSKEIEHGTVWRSSDLSRKIPNLTFVEAGDRRTGTATIRGLSSSSYGNPGAIMYVDDVPITDWEMFNQELFDIDFLSVVRGPDAETNHGASAEFGLIELYTRQPGNSFEGDGSVAYGNYNTFVARAGVGGPIIKDKLMFRLSALESRRDGFLTNTFRDSHPDYRNDLEGRLQLRCVPVPELEVSLTVEGQHAIDGTQTYVSLDANDPFKVQYNEPGHLRQDSYLGALKLTYTTPSLIFSSITSRRSFEADDSHNDLDFTPLPIFDFTYEYAFVQWSQEFRVRSRDNEHWNWQAGGYFEDRGTDILFGNRIGFTPFIQTAPPGGLGLPFTAPIADLHGSHLFGQAYALFGQATYKITEKADITFGLRGEIHRDEMTTRHRLFAPNENTIVPIFDDSGESHSKALLPKVSASYDVTSSLKVYAAANSGYRPGGFAYLIDDKNLNRWTPEHMYNVEVGLKGSWLRNKISGDLTLYDSRIDDYQVRRISNFMFRVDNADRTTSRGGELQVYARPIKCLELSASFGYSDAHFDKYSDQVSGESFDGHALTYASKYTYSINSEYHHETGAFARAEYNGRSSVPFNEENTLEQRAYGLMNARVGYEKAHYSISLFGKNLLDQRYGHFGVPGPGNALVGSPGDPRTFGGEVRFKF